MSLFDCIFISLKPYCNLKKLLRISSTFNKYPRHSARLAVFLRGFLLTNIFSFCNSAGKKNIENFLLFTLSIKTKKIEK